MPYILAMIGTTVLAIAAPYVLPAPPAPAPADPHVDQTQNSLLTISIILGIAVSAFTLVQYFPKGKII